MVSKSMAELPVLLPLQGATFDQDRRHRYVLWRIWDRDLPMVMVIGLNPSTANEDTDDPTVRRCRGFARDWGYGGLWMCNLFSFCTANPKELFGNTDPLARENSLVLKVVRRKVNVAVVAWGNQGAKVMQWRQWPERVVEMLAPVHCLGVTGEGQPKHPLYLPKTAELKLYLRRRDEEKSDRAD